MNYILLQATQSQGQTAQAGNTGQPVFVSDFGIISFILTVFALWIGWRIMNALNRISVHLSELVHWQKGEEASLQRQNALQAKLYRKFLSEDSGRENLPSKERHEAFRIWNEARSGKLEKAA